MMNTIKFLFALAILTVAWPCIAHDLQHTVTEGNAVVIRLHFADDSSFSFEEYMIYAEGEVLPFQVGRTDARGRIVFIPDRPGKWRIRAFSEEGHGADFTIETGPEHAVVNTEKPFFERYTRIIVGVAVIFGIFGVLVLFIAGSRNRKKGGS
jgi:nickel transport protein